MDSDSLTPSQAEAMAAVEQALARNERLFILWYGGVRAGKTVGAVKAMLRHSLEREKVFYIVGGYTISSLAVNVCPVFEAEAEALGLTYHQVIGGRNSRMEIAGNTFLLYGGDHIGRDKRVQGLTAAGLMLDEFELLQKSFVRQCEARISLPGALRVYTNNKENPYSWATKEYYDRAKDGSLKCLLLDVPTPDNQFLDPTFIQEKIDEYDEVTRRRFIENEFALAFPPIYNAAHADFDGKRDISVIYQYGVDCFELPFTNTEYGWVALKPVYHGIPARAADFDAAGVFLVNSNSPNLARDLRERRFLVRGYAADFEPYKIERCQRALASERVRLHPDAGDVLEWLNQYHEPGLIPNPIVTAFETGIDYIERLNRNAVHA